MKGLYGRLPVFVVGGFAYNGLEILVRGYTHWSMFFAGGLCFLLLLECDFRCSAWPVWQKALAGGALITGVEFLFGCVFNLWLGMHVWDYSCYQLQLMGQISLLTSCYWTVLAGAVAAAVTLRERLPLPLFHKKPNQPPAQG